MKKGNRKTVKGPRQVEFQVGKSSEGAPQDMIVPSGRVCGLLGHDAHTLESIYGSVHIQDLLLKSLLGFLQTTV